MPFLPNRSLTALIPATLRRPRLAAILTLSLLPFATACKTTADAAKAAAQMSATATALSSYYAAFATILANTEKIDTVNQQLFSVPYPQANRDKFAKIQKEMQQRAAMASALSTFAATFAKLAGSTAPADVSASALKLDAEVDTLASNKASSLEQRAIKFGLQAIVDAVLAHKEREAAKAFDQTAKALADLFVKESKVYNSLEEVYSNDAAALANNLIDHNAVDYSAMIKPGLDPFNLTPLPLTPAQNTVLAPTVKQQVAARHADLDTAFLKATRDMTDSLNEMSTRIHLVATDKPLAFNLPPVTVAAVEQWAKTIAAQ